MWPYLQCFERKYENFEIDIFGSSTSYMRIRLGYILRDFDFIIFNSPNYFNVGELMKLKDIAFKISKPNKKRVSIGYLYVLPMEERKN